MELFIGGSFQGKSEYVKENYPQAKIWDDFHLFVKKAVIESKSLKEIEEILDEKLKQEPEILIISADIGCGIVPEKKVDRIYREYTGRLLCNLTKKADKVFRITFGIPQRIK